MTTPVRVYVAIEPGCGCATGIVVDDGLNPEDLARCVAHFLKSGRTVERMTLEEGKARIGPCRHNTQQELIP